MPQAPLLTGQDIAEAEGAVTRLLEQTLAKTGTTTRPQYIALRVLVARGPWASPRELHEFLAGQRQLGLTETAAAGLLASLNAAVAPTTQALYAGFDPDDLATTHRVLTQVIERAGQLQA